VPYRKRIEIVRSCQRGCSTAMEFAVVGRTMDDPGDFVLNQ
jgi:hypothetical protein